eukprot:TRINITY_DN70_c2_g1_i1.p1 TRINITY_DN70_c2_g1~~TRINITY_DN70_c2_g1_i1.p1  ORF type:complete len:1371 (+),score=321.27 TRINITY_DN70_c2_g1_i1:64-4113(+)
MGGTCCKSDAGPEEGEERMITVASGNEGFRDNCIVSSKYVLWLPLHYRFFIWKNLFEQFHKVANLYFLLMSGLMQIPGISPFGRWPTLLTLIGVVIVSMIKAVHEDVKRHRDDAKKDGTEVKILKDGEWTTVTWKDVKVGHVVLIEHHDSDVHDKGRTGVPVPADIVLISTSEGTNGVGYVETMDLDGETNLKPKSVLNFESVPGMPDNEIERKHYFMDAKRAGSEPLNNSSLKCDSPHADLTKFWGSLTIAGKEVPIDIHNVMLRGARMSKTEAAVGIAVYTGHDTRLGNNMREPRTKMSRLDRLTNIRLLLIFGIQLFICIVSAIGFRAWRQDHGSDSYYLDFPSDSADAAAVSFFTFFILYGNLIPISLYVSMEMTKMIQGRFIVRDLAMYDETKDLPANVKTTDINDELGAVAHVFSDKTGTLTQNVMQMFKFNCDGETFGTGITSIGKSRAERMGGTTVDPRPARVIDSQTWPLYDERIQDWDTGKRVWASDMPPVTSTEIRKMFETLAVCNTIVPSGGGARPASKRGVSVGLLEAESPDELALVTAAGEMGVALAEADQEKKVVEMHRSVVPSAERNATEDEWIRTTWKQLAVIEFDSDRKRMAVVARKHDPSHPHGGTIHLFMKGADNVMEPLLMSYDKGWKTPEMVQNYVEGGRNWAAGADETETNQREVWMKENKWKTLKNYSNWLEAGRGYKGKQKLMEHMEELEAAKTAEFYQTWWATHDKDVADTGIDLSEQGLRILYIARREVPEREWETWGVEWTQAIKIVSEDDRNAAKKGLAAQLEQDLALVGVTAIEDKLQAKVPETIASLREAGIKVWMITGDKKTTAINIGHACLLLDKTLDDPTSDPPINPIELDGEGKDKAQIIKDLDKAHALATKRKQEGVDYAVVITSSALKVIFAPDDDVGKQKSSFDDCSGEAADKLYDITFEAKSVIVARATPMQKAQVVNMIKSRNEWNVTLAIGDGANDVAMIQQAHIGIGIKGLEGGQAAAQSDYAIGQFRFLHRLLFVHGRWNYRRLALFYCYFFYKNAVLSFSLFFYNFLNGFSGQPLYDMWVVAGFNVSWAALPVITVAIIDRDIVNTNNLHNFPLLYKHGRMNHDYTSRRMAQWYMNAVFHAILCVYIPVVATLEANILDKDGRDYGLFHLGVLVYTNVVLCVTLKLALHVSSWTWLHHIFFWCSFATWPIFLVLYGAVFFSYGTMNGELEDSASWAMFWMILITTMYACLTRDFVWRYISYRVMPLLPPSELETLIQGRVNEPGFRSSCTVRPMTLLKIVRLLDSAKDGSSWEKPVELQDVHEPFNEDTVEAKKRMKDEARFGTFIGDCGISPKRNPNVQKKVKE